MKYYIKAMKDEDSLYLHEDGYGLSISLCHAMYMLNKAQAEAVLKLHKKEFKEYELSIYEEN